MPYSDLDIMWNNWNFYYYLSFVLLLFNYNLELLNISVNIKLSLEKGFKCFTMNKNLTLWFFITYIVLQNLYGLFPFFFSFSSHFFMSLSMALMSYFCCMYVKNTKNPLQFFNPIYMSQSNKFTMNLFTNSLKHLTTSLSKLFISSIHITTLSFRLGMNMSAGHMIMGVYSKTMVFLFMFLFYEIFACFMQSFIFYLMSNIYFS